MNKMTTRLLLIVAACLLLTGCGQGWGWYVVDPTTKSGLINLKFLMSGFWYTIVLSLVSLLIAIPIGLLVALPGFSSNIWLKGFNRVYVELVRALPVLVAILWIHYGLPTLFPAIDLPVFWSGVIALSLCETAFLAEIFRAGIQSIPKGQTEAAQSISLSYYDRMRYVILPQALRRILPAIGNQFVYMLKMSSLVSVIGMGELVRKANELAVTEYRALEIYSVLVLEYLVLILVVSAGVRWLEKRMDADESK
jgi:glutamine transport system permease protein